LVFPFIINRISKYGCFASFKKLMDGLQIFDSFEKNCQQMSKPIKRSVFSILFIPLLFQVIIWSVKAFELVFHLELTYLGILPQKLVGLSGIFTSPFVHADFEHLISNALPMFVLSLGLFNFYPQRAYLIFVLLIFLEGMGVWIGGREAYHIGCSGLVYGLASFIFFSGIFTGKKQLAAISLLVVFLYGGMIWGIFPNQPHISWESHFLGFLAGLILAFYFYPPAFRKKKRDEEPEHPEDYSQISATGNFKHYQYEFKEGDSA
jgi:membrane associated rhomboid family serine protease